MKNIINKILQKALWIDQLCWFIGRMVIHLIKMDLTATEESYYFMIMHINYKSVCISYKFKWEAFLTSILGFVVLLMPLAAIIIIF